MRKIEKEYLKSLGYSLIELPKSQSVYEEICSHTDIFISKIKNNIIVEPSFYDSFIKQINEKSNNDSLNYNIIKADKYVQEKYPLDIAYNVCIVGKYAIHNFKYTSKKVLEVLKKENYELININQGYSNCSIAVIDDNSIITSDKGIYKTLSKYDFDILFLDNSLDIKLLNNYEYSNKKGFIGGCISRINNKIFITGDLNKIDSNNLIRNFIKSKNLEIIEFIDLDVIDYGGIVSLNE